MSYVIDGGYLSHHGIPGMKWGEKNGPPYPIRDGEHSAAEVKANPKLEKPTSNNDSGKRKRERLKNLSDSEIRKRIERQKLEDEYLRSQGKMTRQQKNELRVKTMTNIASVLTSDIPKTGLGLAKDFVNYRLLFVPRLTLAILESAGVKTGAEAIKDMLNMFPAKQKHLYKIEEEKLGIGTKKEGKKDKSEDKSEDKKDEDS